MAQISVIRKSQLEGAMRLDAEYYQPKYIQWTKHIEDIGYSELRAIGKIAYGTTPTGGVFEESGIPFIRSQNFTLLNVDVPSLAYCSDEFHRQNLKSVVKPADVLLAAVGATIGQVAIAPWDVGEANINQNIARVHITSNDFLPAYVVVFLSTYWGQFQIKRLVTGNAQQYLNSHQIGQLKIPKLPLERQAELERFFLEVSRKLNDSESLYLQAKQLLLDEIGFKDLDLGHQVYWTVPFKKTQEANRLDAEHFRPKYERLIQYIQRLPYLRLRDVTQTIRNGKTPAAEDYSMEGVPILKVGGLRNTGAIEECCAYVPASWAQANTKGAVKQFDALVLCAAHLPSYIGKTGLLMEDLGPLARAVGELIILRFNNKVCPEFVCVYLNLGPVRLAVQRLTRGNTAHLYPDDLSTLPIPLLPSEFQQRIADLVTQSWEARQKARQLLEEAKNKVENLIEGRA